MGNAAASTAFIAPASQSHLRVRGSFQRWQCALHVVFISFFCYLKEPHRQKKKGRIKPHYFISISIVGEQQNKKSNNNDRKYSEKQTNNNNKILKIKTMMFNKNNASTGQNVSRTSTGCAMKITQILLEEKSKQLFRKTIIITKSCFNVRCNYRRCWLVCTTIKTN